MNKQEYMQRKINELIENPAKKMDITEYNKIIDQLTKMQEFKATVFVYDHMKNNKVTPNQTTMDMINRLHSKTLPENSNIKVELDNSIKRLRPRRRIHKIMKGYNYSDNYNDAVNKHLDAVEKYLANHTELKTKNKIYVSKQLSKECNITTKDAKYVVTYLKRRNYFEDPPDKIIKIDIGGGLSESDSEEEKIIKIC